MQSSSIKSVKFYLTDQILAVKVKKGQEETINQELKNIQISEKKNKEFLFEDNGIFGKGIGEIVYRKNKKFEQIPIQINGEVSSILLPVEETSRKAKNLIIAPEMIEKDERTGFHQNYTLLHKYTYGYMIEYFGNTKKTKNGFSSSKERNEEVRKLTDGTWDFEKAEAILKLQYEHGLISMDFTPNQKKR